MLKSKTKKIMVAAAGMLLLCSVAAAETAGLQTVTKAGSNATVQANPKNFTGTAWALPPEQELTGISILQVSR